MSISNTENNSDDIQALFKSEVYFLLCFILFSPSQKNANKIISKTDDEILEILLRLLCKETPYMWGCLM